MIPAGNAIAIAAGNMHACALLTTSQVVCWGSNGGGQSAGCLDGIGAHVQAAAPVIGR